MLVIQKDEFILINVYIINSGLEKQKLEAKKILILTLRSVVRKLKQDQPNIMIVGDFNMTRDDTEVEDSTWIVERIPGSFREDQDLWRDLLRDELEEIEPEEKKSTWRNNHSKFGKINRGMFLDRCIVTKELRETFEIEVNILDDSRTSDHRPVKVTLRKKNGPDEVKEHMCESVKKESE